MFRFLDYSVLIKLYGSPPSAAEAARRLWTMEDIVALIDAAEGPAKKRGPPL